MAKPAHVATHLTQLPAHTHYSVLQIVGEVGCDLSKWPTEKHFTAWTELAPGNHDSGKRKGHVKRGRNRTGQLFCMMARSLVRSKDIALGGFYRRMRARRGGLVATMALARKLAAWYWRIMVKGDDYVEQGLARYDAQVLLTKQRALKRLAKELGQQPVPSLSRHEPRPSFIQAFEIKDLAYGFMERVRRWLAALTADAQRRA